jgi:hypothetical protein
MGILSSQQAEEMQRYFPEGCFFHWDGQGEPPIGSEIVYQTAKVRGDTHSQVCMACSSLESCVVRMDRQRKG